MKKIIVRTERWCPKCENLLPIDDFYYYPKNGKYSHRCISCTKKVRREHDQELRRIEIDLDGQKPLNDPMTYNSEKERLETRSFLELIGYHFNEKLDLFWKEGIRNEDGTFILKPKEPKIYKVRINKLRIMKIIEPGTMFGALEVIKESIKGLSKKGQIFRQFEVRCGICGTVKIMSYSNLTSHNSTTCSFKCYKIYKELKNE